MSEVSTRPVLAMLLPSFFGGGAERVMVQVANLLHRRGYAVEMVVLKSEGEFLSELDAGIAIIELNVSRALLGVPPLTRYLRRSRPRVLLSALNHMNVVAVMARAWARAPTSVIVSVRCNVSEELAVPRSFVDRLLPGLIRWLYPYADRILCVSQGVMDDLGQFAPKTLGKLDVIYNPVLNKDYFSRLQEPVPKAFTSQVGGRFILAVGRLSPQKDYGCLLRAFRQVRNQENVSLLILGEGPERANLERLVSELGLSGDVLMPGFTPNPFPLMRRCSIYVSSSRWEGLPGVLIQALAAGARVISTDCPSGAREILEDGAWGELVPVGDENAMAAAMLDALRSSDLRDQSALKASLGERFGEASVLLQYMALLERFGLSPKESDGAAG